MSNEKRGSRFERCHFYVRATPGDETPLFAFQKDGSVYVNLVGYTVVPTEYLSKGIKKRLMARHRRASDGASRRWSLSGAVRRIWGGNVQPVDPALRIENFREDDDGSA